MAEIAVAENMEVVGSDGIRVGIVDEADHNHIRLARGSTIQGNREGFHYYVPRSLVASVEENQVRLSVKADDATLVELNSRPGAPRTSLEPSGGAEGWDWNSIAVAAAGVGIVAVAGALLFSRRGRSDEEDTPETDQPPPQGEGGAATGLARSNSTRKKRPGRRSS